MDEKQESGATDTTALQHQQRLGFLVYRAGLAVSRGYERALKPIGIMPVEAGVLGSLGYGGPNHLRGLARQLGVGRQTIVNVTRVLEQRGWISRAPSDQDARLVIFSISPAGRTKLVSVEDVAQTFDGKLGRVVSPPHAILLIEQLQRIVDAPFLAHED
jgi:MarR family transcriptional regulator, lower aerobic nicotinate degradation pathway regulator